MDEIVFVNRKKDAGKSIEGIFEDLRLAFNKSGIAARTVEVPHAKIRAGLILKNILFVNRLKGVIHVTGDIHYVCINPFKRTILTVHDIGFVSAGSLPGRFMKKLLWLWLPSFFVKKITVVSAFTKTELSKHIPWAKSKIVVIPNPVNSQFKFAEKAFNRSIPSILLIGTGSNKNIENTLKGLEGISSTVNIVGHLSEEQLNLLKQLQIRYENHTDVSLEDIIRLYKEADIVSFISFYEGFGMPVIEAQKTGRAVITSRCTSIPEVAGKGALFVSTTDIAEIKAGFERIINDDPFRQNLIDLGRENIKRFEMPGVMEKYLDLYRSCGFEMEINHGL